MLSERFYGGIGEKSIGYPRKVLEFPRTATYIRSLPSHPRSESIIQPFRCLRKTDPIPPIPCRNITHLTLRHLRTSGRSAPKPFFDILCPAPSFIEGSIRIAPLSVMLAPGSRFPSFVFFLHFVSCSNSVHREEGGKVHGRTELWKERQFRFDREISSDKWRMAKEKKIIKHHS